MGIKPMQDEIVFVVEKSPESGYEARAVEHSIYTCADTLDKLRVMAEDAVRCHFDEDERPSIIRLHLVSEEVFET